TLTNVTVATFTDPGNPSLGNFEDASGYSVSINWGDTTSANLPPGIVLEARSGAGKTVASVKAFCVLCDPSPLADHSIFLNNPVDQNRGGPHGVDVRHRRGRRCRNRHRSRRIASRTLATSSL